MTEATDDIAKRRRVLQLTEELADLMGDVGERVRELKADLYVATNDIVDLTFESLPPKVRDAIHGVPFAANIDLLYMMLTGPKVADVAGRGSALEEWIHEHGAGMPEMGDVLSSLGDAARSMASNPNLHRPKMEVLIERLFAEAPKLEGSDGKPVEGQAPALQCHIMLRPGHTLQGALSITKEGMLRMLTPTEIPDPQTRRTKTVLAEQFFDYDDVVAIVLERDVKMSTGSRIHTS